MIAGMTYYQICCFFLIYSFLGWVIEVMYHAVTLGKVVNRGFLNGPVCPVYGFGMLGVLALAGSVNPEDATELPPLLLFLAGILLATAIELIAGWLLDVLFHARWWDYSDKPFNLHGYICLEFSIIWGLGIVFIMKILHPFISNTSAARISARYGWPVLAFFYLVYLVDLICTVAVIRNFNRRVAELDELQRRLRIVSDRMSERITTDTIKAAQTVQEGRVQTALAKAELRDRLEETRKELQNNVSENKKELQASLAETKKELEQRRQELQNKLLSGRHIGSSRLLRAFPSYKHKNHDSIVQELKKKL